ncbi:MAG: hydroxypyruvate isomerase family protein [Planctomycetota bacterium]|jgi:hydroxypyruvate isomerase
MSLTVSRRTALLGLATGAAAATGATIGRSARAGEAGGPLEGNVNHSVCRWCYSRIPLETLCRECRRIGIKSIELVGPKEWPTLKKYGLTCAMSTGGLGIAKGFNRLENHDRLVAGYEDLVPQAAAAGVPSVICMSGNRQGMDDDEGLKNCLTGVKRVVSLFEKHKVNLVMELLNSKVDHADYMCDHTSWGAELCKTVGSERFKLLYDVYHMQIMEGDIIRTIRQSADCIGHYHTGGNPGRNEIDETQEIYYPAVMRAIVETEFRGFVAQEFKPTWENPIEALEKCVRICDV